MHEGGYHVVPCISFAMEKQPPPECRRVAEIVSELPAVPVRCAALLVLPKPWTLVGALVQGKLRLAS